VGQAASALAEDTAASVACPVDQLRLGTHSEANGLKVASPFEQCLGHATRAVHDATIHIQDDWMAHVGFQYFLGVNGNGSQRRFGVRKPKVLIERGKALRIAKAVARPIGTGTV
jgi:hypothetical protein